MTEINYSAMLRALVDDYFSHAIDRVEYFTQRREILDRIDRDFNGEIENSGWPAPDITQPHDITRPSLKKSRGREDSDI